jgi:hypothetical protein
MTDNTNEIKTITWSFKCVEDTEVKDKLDCPSCIPDVTFKGTEENIRKFFAFFWDMNVDSEEIDEIFEDQ